MARTASSSYVEYGYESAFGVVSTTFPLVFGKEQKANGMEFNNNQIPLGQLNSPEIESFVYGRNEGKVSMEYVLSNPFVLTSIFDDPVTTGAGPFAHTWSSDPSINSSIRDIKSLSLQVGYEGLLGNVVRTIKGVVSPSMALRMSLGEPIRVTQELIWGIDSAGTTLDSSIASDTGFTPFIFANASIELPSGTTIATIQDFDLNMNSNAALLYQLGTADSVDAYRKILDITGKINLTVLDKTNIDRVFARTELATMKVNITNGLSGTDIRDIILTFTGVGLSTHTNSGIEPGELVLENIDFQCRSASIVANNNTSVQPA